MKHIITISPGSNFTYMAYYHDKESVAEMAVDFPKPELRHRIHVLDEYNARMNSIREFLCRKQIDIENVDIFVSCGGAPANSEEGIYEIDKYVVKLLCFEDASHCDSSRIAPILAYSMAQESGGKPAIIYDYVAKKMQSPVECGLKVLNGEVKVRKYTLPPQRFDNLEECVSHFVTVRADIAEEPTVQEFLSL